MNKIKIPPDKQIKLTIQTGTVYFMNLINKGYDDETPHFYVVLNKTPKTDSKIIMCWITTESETHTNIIQNKNFSDRFVRLTDKDYDELTAPSVINCHNFEERSLDEIISKLEEGKLFTKKQMNIEIVTNIRSKLLNSPTLEKRIETILFDS